MCQHQNKSEDLHLGLSASGTSSVSIAKAAVSLQVGTSVVYRVGCQTALAHL
jgi:hypothetical protein